MSLPAFAFAVPSSNRVCVVRTRDVHWKSRPREGGSGRGAAGGSSVSREGGRGETRRDRRARAAVVFISRETPLHWPKSSPVCCHSTLRRRSVRQPHRAAPPGEPLECGNSPRSVRRPRASDDVHCCLPEPVSRNLFKAPEYIKSQQGGGGRCFLPLPLPRQDQWRSEGDSNDEAENPSRPSSSEPHPNLIKICMRRRAAAAGASAPERMRVVPCVVRVRS